MDQDLIRVLEKISNALEENTTILNRIADHYDGVVPVMTRNAKRVEEAHEEAQTSFLGNLFKEPQEQEN